MSLSANSSRRIRSTDLHVDPEARPGWTSGAVRLPDIGERVYCTEGPAEVTRVLGKVSDGSRLLELQLPDPAARPFYAAASNVLVDPARY